MMLCLPLERLQSIEGWAKHTHAILVFSAKARASCSFKDPISDSCSNAREAARTTDMISRRWKIVRITWGQQAEFKAIFQCADKEKQTSAKHVLEESGQMKQGYLDSEERGKLNSLPGTHSLQFKGKLSTFPGTHSLRCEDQLSTLPGTISLQFRGRLRTIPGTHLLQSENQLSTLPGTR